MNLIGLLIVIAVMALLTICLMKGGCLPGRTRRVRLANTGEGRHTMGVINVKADAQITERYRIVKRGSDANHVAITAALGDKPLGVCLDEPEAAEKNCAVQLLGCGPGTVFMRAAAAITQDDLLEPVANGRVQTLTTSVGTHYCVGRALQAAANAGDIIEVDPCFFRFDK
jgi:hypothetical protein